MTRATRLAETNVMAGHLAASGLSRWTAVLADYWTLTKPEVNFLILITAFAGFYLGSPGSHWRILLLFNTLVGTMLVASGTGTLNQYIERRFDAQMRRTAGRPLPAGRIHPSRALWFGVVLSVAGSFYLAVLVNLLASVLALVTLSTYLLLYTPLKRKTPLCTLVGAFPGAVPPLIGWAAATGHLDSGAWLLFLILFFWQFPHFNAIAWMYREDYARAGIRMLSVGDTDGSRTFRQILISSSMLVVISLLPSVLRMTGVLYFFGALIVSTALVQVCFWAAKSKSNVRAKWLMHATVLHIPVLLALMAYDKIAH